MYYLNLSLNNDNKTLSAALFEENADEGMYVDRDIQTLDDLLECISKQPFLSDVKIDLSLKREFKSKKYKRLQSPAAAETAFEEIYAYLMLPKQPMVIWERNGYFNGSVLVEEDEIVDYRNHAAKSGDKFFKLFAKKINTDVKAMPECHWTRSATVLKSDQNIKLVLCMRRKALIKEMIEYMNYLTGTNLSIKDYFDLMQYVNIVDIDMTQYSDKKMTDEISGFMLRCLEIQNSKSSSNFFKHGSNKDILKRLDKVLEQFPDIKDMVSDKMESNKPQNKVTLL